MSGFSADWLALREAADHRSRSADLAEALAARFLGRERIAVVDVGCGTGSNLRAMAHLLPDEQTWTLIDYDANLLAAARERLAAWADKADVVGGGILLIKGGKRIRVALRQADLSGDLDSALPAEADLVTAAAFFDLASPEFIKRFAAAVAKRRAVFYTVLTYNGIQRWTPRSPADQAMAAAFHAHQVTDKGFGASAGPTAPQELADAFAMHGYGIEEGDSPWDLRAADQALVAELQEGHAAAVSEMGAVDAATIASWRALKRTGAVVGHTDTLAVPPLEEF